jgi:predicted transcriptional regulator YdeE
MKLVTVDAFNIVGIEARTSNTREASPEGLIGAAWGRFMGEGLLAKIPGRADDSIIALYTDYESDYRGPYTFVLGAKVASDAEPPAGMVQRQVPAARYAVFEVPQGPPERVVVETWQKIWADTTITRVYTADFESYSAKGIEIYIAVA